MEQNIEQSFFGRGLPSVKISKSILQKFKRLAPLIIKYSRLVAKKIKKRNEYQIILFPQEKEPEESNQIQHSLQKQYQKKSFYPFYLSKCNLFIDNYHLKIMKQDRSLSLKISNLGYGNVVSFGRWVNHPSFEHIVVVTEYAWIIIICIQEKKLLKFRCETKDNQQLTNVCCYGDFIFAFTQRQCFIHKYKNNKSKGKEVQKIAQVTLTNKMLKTSFGIQINDSFYIFSLIGNCLISFKLQMGIFWRLEPKYTKLFEDETNSITNLEIYYQKQRQNILLGLSTFKQFVVISYKMDINVPIILKRMVSPFVTWRNFQKVCSPIIRFIRNEDRLYCAVAFINRLYFLKIDLQNFCEISKRIKFQFPIQEIGTLGKQVGIFIISRISREKRRIYLTHENKLIGFQGYMNLQLIEKYQIDVVLSNIITENNDCISFSHPYTTFQNKQILVNCGDRFERIVLNRWRNIYEDLKVTENIKLLKFLILIKTSFSPFLQPPNNFDDLEAFFPLISQETARILLEYYFLMNMAPKRVSIESNHNLMIPFIIEHKISNISERTKREMINYWIRNDERLVEQLIIGGSQYGQNFAVSRGWIRAFKIMVERGMEVQMPVLKLTSLAIAQKKLRTESDGEEIEFMTQNGLKFCNQIVEYILFVLNNFFLGELSQEGREQMKQFLKIILKVQILNLIIKYSPELSVRLVSSIFMSDARIQQVNSFNTKQFAMCTNNFRQLLRGQNYSLSQAMVSHVSELYRTQNYESHYQELLEVEQSKLLILNFKNYLQESVNQDESLVTSMNIYEEVNCKYWQDIEKSSLFRRYIKQLKIGTSFSFEKDYLKRILITLTKQENSHLINIFRQNRNGIQLQVDENQFECEMIDFLVYLWSLIYIQIFKSTVYRNIEKKQKISKEEKQRIIKKEMSEEIKILISNIQQHNYKYQYLIIHLMLASNTENQFTNKIFRKFILCKNQIIKSRIFIWLNKVFERSSFLKDQVIRNLKELIEIDKEETRILLETYYEGKEKQIINKIDNDPFLQLEYIELIIKNADQQIEDYYTNLHISLLLELRPESIINILEIRNDLVKYDISEILRMTLRKDQFALKNDILIYLYQREGEIVRCIQTYLKKMESQFCNYVDLTEKCLPSQEQEFTLAELTKLNKNYTNTDQINYKNEALKIKQIVEIKYSQVLQLIFRQPLLDQIYLFTYLDKINLMMKAISQSSYRHKGLYLFFLAKYFGQFIIQIYERGCLKHLSNWIQKSEGKVSYREIVKYFIEGYKRLHYQNIILKTTLFMEKHNLIEQIKQTCQKMEYCISSEAKCMVCRQSFKDQSSQIRALLFSCGHLYHKSCIDQVNGQDFCYYCVSKNQYKAMAENFSLCLVELLEKYRLKKAQAKQNMMKIEGIEAKQILLSIERKRLNRLKIFDKKVTSIDNQAQIIDVKLYIDEYYRNQLIQ